MGGGEFVRAAAKMAGVGSVTGVRGASTVPHFEQLLRGSARPASVVLASSSSLHHAKASLEYAHKPSWETDDWEFASFEDTPEPRIVFGSVPTLDEAKEAAIELKDALDKVYLSSSESSVSNLDASSNYEPETKPRFIIGSSPNSVPKQAIQAFRLLKESPEVQTVVASIASDQKVWNAMLENKELKSFLHSYQTNKELEFQKLAELEDEPGASNAKESGNIFSDMFQHIKASIVDMVTNASSFFQKVFGFLAAEVSGDDKKESSEFTNPEIVAGSIMGLVILVVLAVVVKRN